MIISDQASQNQREIENMKALQATTLKNLNKNVITQTFSASAGNPRRILGISLSNDLSRVPVAVLGVRVLTSGVENARVIVIRSPSQSTGQVNWTLDCSISRSFQIEVQAVSNLAGTLSMTDLGTEGDWY